MRSCLVRRGHGVGLERAKPPKPKHKTSAVPSNQSDESQGLYKVPLKSRQLGLHFLNVLTRTAWPPPRITHIFCFRLTMQKLFKSSCRNNSCVESQTYWRREECSLAGMVAGPPIHCRWSHSHFSTLVDGMLCDFSLLKVAERAGWSEPQQPAFSGGKGDVATKCTSLEEPESLQIRVCGPRKTGAPINREVPWQCMKALVPGTWWQNPNYSD